MTNFKGSQAASASSAANALQQLHLDDEDNDDDLSDEYDHMDDVGDHGRTRQPRENHKFKYMDLLQKVADRTSTEVLIELDDLEKVSIIIDYLSETWC